MVVWKKLPGVLNSHDELSEFREIFDLVDKDGSGTITKDELGELLGIIGIETSNDDLERMVKGVDANFNGEVDFEEFATFMTRRISPGYSIDQVKNAFQIVQEETGTPPGFVHRKDIAKFIHSHYTNTHNHNDGDSERLVDEETAEELSKQLECDANGMVDYHEYVDMMMRW